MANLVGYLDTMAYSTQKETQSSGALTLAFITDRLKNAKDGQRKNCLVSLSLISWMMIFAHGFFFLDKTGQKADEKKVRISFVDDV